MPASAPPDAPFRRRAGLALIVAGLALVAAVAWDRLPPGRAPTDPLQAPEYVTFRVVATLLTAVGLTALGTAVGRFGRERRTPAGEARP